MAINEPPLSTGSAPKALFSDPTSESPFGFKKTSQVGVEHQKVLLYAHHGFGKTYQCRYFQQRYGKGLVISGESGMASLKDVDIDVAEFTSWDGAHDPANGIFSFKGICGMIAHPSFKAAGYTWIAIDSLTELSDRCMEWVERGLIEAGLAKGKSAQESLNDLRKWQDYGRALKGALKWVRDLPYHVFMTCLAKGEKNENDEMEHWPAVQQRSIAETVPGLFDHVFCGVRQTVKDPATGITKVRRLVITDEVNGWHGKARDPRHRLKPIEEGVNIVDLLDRMAMDDDAFEKLSKQTTGE